MEYKYKNLPITPQIIEELIIELFNGSMMKRDDIVSKVLEHHVSQGGKTPEAQNFVGSVKKALGNLKEKGDATNPGYGHWQIQKADAPIIPEDIAIAEPLQVDDIPTHTTYGSGANAIYLYYFPSYKQLAEAQNKLSWPCKIGRTDRDPLIRIMTQAQTALPEKPIIEFVIKTSDSSLLEAAIHSALTLRGKHIKDAPGTEWFDTNPHEVLDLIKFINNSIL